MFTMIITEKGGAQRRMEFDKNEVTIGRVQGNDIILPKGNVSKRHSRIVLKDSRFIVVDLKSTNGTYVNGRKITSPLVIKAGDKIYIGDFILTLDEAAAAAGDYPPAPPADAPPPLPPPEARPRRSTGGGGGPPPLRPQGGGRADAPPPLPPREEALATHRPPPPQAEPPPERFPIDEEPAPERAPARPPRVPRESEPQAAPPPLRPSASEPPAAPPSQPPPPRERPTSKRAAVSAGPAPSFPSGPAPTPGVPAKGAAAALQNVMMLVAEGFDAHEADARALHDRERWGRAQSIIKKAVEQLRGEGAIDGVDPGDLESIALREAVGLGPLEALMADDSVREIVVEGASRIVADFGNGLERVDAAFSSPAAVMTAARRLIAQAGEPTDVTRPVIEVTLPSGSHVTAVFPPVAVRGPVIEIRRTGPGLTLADLVERATLSTEMSDALREAVEAGRSILVAGAVGAGVTTLLGALASLVPEGQRIVTVEDVPDLVVTRDHVISLATGGPGSGMTFGDAVQQGLRLRADRLVIDDVRGADVLPALRAVVARPAGSLVGVHTGDQHPALDGLRLAATLAGAPAAAFDELLARATELVAHVVRTPEGYRVDTISEVVYGPDGLGLRDLFVLEDGSFRAA